MTSKNITSISNSIQEIKSLLTTQTSEFIDIDEASKLLKLKKSYLYNLVYHKKIPFYKPFGKKLYFKVSELHQFIENSREESFQEFSRKYELNRKPFTSPAK